MKVGIIGLGLMGASFARTLKKAGGHEVYGFDRSDDVMRKADLIGMLDGTLTLDNAGEIDMIIVALYPRDFKAVISPYLPRLKPGAIVTDFCGTKRLVVSEMQKMQKEYPDLFFVGGHPMAGREFSGIEHSVTNLFDRASMIIVPVTENIAKLDALKKFYLSLGFGEVMVCSADYHDGMIAFTSQLCHIVSNAYVKNKRAEVHDGFSAGSYRDLTRVARRNGKMWSELMIDNRDFLSDELGEIIGHLTEYKQALDDGDETRLATLLEDGNRRKLDIDVKGGRR